VGTLLVNPPYPLTEWPNMPLGLSYIAAVLEKNGVEVKVLDLLVSEYSEEKVCRSMAEFRPEVVGVTAVTMNYPISSNILRLCKTFDENVITVIGGPHVTFCAERTLKEAPWIDIVVRGEGENTMLDIVRGKALPEIEGLVFRKEDGVVVTGDRPWIKNLDELPFPARHLFPLSNYHAFSAGGTLITGRGCPFNCIFCAGHRMTGRRVRLRNPKLVVDEMQLVQELGFKEIYVEDDLLTLNHVHVNAICDEILSRGLKLRWNAFSRVDTVSRELLKKMKQAGCFGLLYGVESGNQEILDRAKKKITLEKVRQAVALAKEMGMNPVTSFILGLPGETRDTMRQSYDFARQLGTSCGFHVLAPFPGTEVREKAEEYGITILTDDWSKYDANRAVTTTPDAGVAEVTEILREYYSDIKHYISYQKTQAQEGKLSDDEAREVRLRSERRFAWSLLKSDCIEKLGPLELGESPTRDLARRLAQRLSLPLDQAEEQVTRLEAEGLLVRQVENRHVLWSWSRPPRSELYSGVGVE
jgi:anaerobic magnesium-protoporphyrin IX monomethyl ester cyclase